MIKINLLSLLNRFVFNQTYTAVEDMIGTNTLYSYAFIYIYKNAKAIKNIIIKLHFLIAFI